MARLKVYIRAFNIGLALVCMASTPRAAWSQWTGGPTGPIYYDAGRVGIGTTAPQSTLELGGLAPELRISHAAGYFDSNFPFLRMFYSNQEFVQLTMDGHYSTVVNTSASAGLGHLLFLTKAGGKVGIGTTSPQYLLSVNGTMGAKDVIVTNTGWSDYVFDPGYRLRPLSELDAYIQAHRRLPDIPSEAEVKGKGVRVGEMQAKLLAKIEELTLHMIQQDKENRELRDCMERENQKLRERISQLEVRTDAGGAPRAVQ